MLRHALVPFLALCVCPVLGQTELAAVIDSSQVLSNPSDSTATGLAQFTLNEEQTELTYSMQFSGLDLEELAENRTDDNDIVAIHLHLNVPDVIGPHILNIFGVPAFDDADLVVDYDNETLTGVFDMSDASRDPNTNEVLPQSFPLTTKLFPSQIRLDELLGGDWYIAVHTYGSRDTPPGVTIRGNIFVVPEPGCVALCLGALLCRPSRRRRR